MVEGVLVFCGLHLSPEVAGLQEHGEIFEVVVCESELTWMGLRWIVYLHVSQSQRVFDRLFLTKHCRCFCLGTKGADGAADLLQALSNSPLLEAFSFYDCSQIPAAAWQKLHGSKWLNLKRASFAVCLVIERDG